MRHPTEGVLRRLLDEPVSVPDADRAHVLDCPHCLTGLASARADADAVAGALSPGAEVPTSELDTARAWKRLSTSTTVPRQGGAAVRREQGRREPRLRRVVQRPAVAALAVAFVLGGAGTAAANGWLQIFRTEKITPVSFSTRDLVALPDVSAYGDLTVSSEPDVHEVPNAAAAEAESRLDVPSVADLPRGVSGKPSYQVGSTLTGTFTFSAAKAAQAAAAAGKTPPPVPAGLDGSQVRLQAGPGVAAIWTASASRTPALVVARAVAPTAQSSGVPFETVRDYLLSLPGLPEDVAAQLRTFTADGSTLPLPVPRDLAVTTSTQVNGVPATLVVTRDHTLAAVAWVQDGVATVVAGALDADEVLAVARGLQ